MVKDQPRESPGLDCEREDEARWEAIENAKKNGRWDAAYDSPSGAIVPSDFQAALDANPRASEFFKNLDRANRYAILWRIQTVKKAETRTRLLPEVISAA